MAIDIERDAIKKYLFASRNPCVVELGAHRGEDEGWIRQCFHDAVRYVMVEPDIHNALRIIEQGIHPSRHVVVAAITSQDGDVDFHASLDGNSDMRGSGSIRAPLRHTELFPHIQFPETMKVPGLTLDTLFHREWLSKIDLLWVDIQGAERDMIEGGSKALSHTRYLFIETETSELYAGMALKTELIGLLPGWELIEEFEDNCLLHNPNFVEAPPR